MVLTLIVLEDGGGGERLLQLEEGCNRLQGLVELDSLDGLASEEGERGGDGRVAVDELAVEVGEAEEGLRLFHRAGPRPLHDGGDLARVHSYPLC